MAATKKEKKGIFAFEPEDGEEFHGAVETERISFTKPKKWISSGVSLLDAVLGNGGYASGRIVEIYGPERTGKSELIRTMFRAHMAESENNYGFFYDQEQATVDYGFSRDPVLAEALQSRLVIGYARTAEIFFKRVEDVLTNVSTAHPDASVLIAVDSLPGLIPKAVQEGEMDDLEVAALARLLSRNLPKIRDLIHRTGSLMVFVNQIRTGPNKQAFQEDESPGGKALKFWADYRIRTYNMGTFSLSSSSSEEKGPPDGLLTRFKTIKNKLAPPLRQCEMPILFSHKMGSPSGISEVWGLFNFLKKQGFVVTKGGKYFIKGGEESFSRNDWPLVFSQLKPKIDECVKKWSDDILMKSDQH